ncbi:conserved exported hypothetical protein [Gammaproteobacteria bacterium]
MRKYLVTLLALFGTNALALNAFDPATKTLTIDSVTQGGTRYNNVVVKITGVEIVGVGTSQPTQDSQCPVVFTEAQYNAISVGMTMAQVSDIIGCGNDVDGSMRAGNDILHSWETSGNIYHGILVNFDATTGLVAVGADNFFKKRKAF